MRKRSGGLHCETEQQFIQLAQLSQQKCGLYYDDDLNRKKSQLNKAKAKKKKPQKPLKPPPKPSLFLDFDFNQDDIENKQTLIELTKSSNINLSFNITIICANPSFERLQLQTIIQQNQYNHTITEQDTFWHQINQTNKKNYGAKVCEERVIDLHIHKIRRGESELYNAYKFWFVKINSTNAEICATYLNLSTELFRINRETATTEIDLEEHPSIIGKRHVVREVNDSAQMLSQMKIGDSGNHESKGGQVEEERRRLGESVFSPHYVSNEEEFFQVWNNDQRFEGKR